MTAAVHNENEFAARGTKQGCWVCAGFNAHMYNKGKRVIVSYFSKETSTAIFYEFHELFTILTNKVVSNRILVNNYRGFRQFNFSF